MGNFTVETMCDGNATTRAAVQAASDTDAAKTLGKVEIPLGPEPKIGEWIRVTHLASGRTSWFRVAR